MPLRAEQLPAALEKGLSPLYLIAGPEPLLVQECRDQVFAAAFGPHQPVAPNDSDEQRAKNRRVELTTVPRRDGSVPENAPGAAEAGNG